MGRRKVVMTNLSLLRNLITEDTDDCVLWPKGTDSSGYPKVWDGARNVGGHRLAYMLHKGVIMASSLEVMHTCDTPRCVNPKHLKAGTHAANMADMHRKGRGVVPSRRQMDRGTVRRIRRLHAAGVPIQQIADSVGFKYGAVHAVCTRRNWGWLV